MKKQLSLFAAMLIAVSVAGNMQSAAAEDTAVYPESVCPGFEPLSDDLITVTVTDPLPVSVEIVQHSPERENLVLYQYDAKSAGTYIFRAEPGDYTVKVTAEAVKGSAVRYFAYSAFRINDANDSVGEDAYELTDYQLSCSCLAVDSSQPCLPVVSDPESAVSDGKMYITQHMDFKQYAVFRGDYDADGDTDNADAQLVLNDYAAWVADKEFRPDKAPGQIAAADYDGDGNLSAADAQEILLFYTMQVAGQIPQWSDGIPDVRNYVINDAGKVVIAD